MLNRTATGLAKRLLSHGVITKDSLEVYVYGFELLLSSLFSITVMVIAGFVMNKNLETIAFLVVFIILRSFTGGYHADTYAKCSITTFSVYSAVMLFSTYIQVGLILYIILLIIGIIVLWLKAPVENSNKELTAQEKKKHRIISIMLFFFFCVVGMGLNLFLSVIGATVWAALVVDLSLIFVKSNYERRKV